MQIIECPGYHREEKGGIVKSTPDDPVQVPIQEIGLFKKRIKANCPYIGGENTLVNRFCERLKNSDPSAKVMTGSFSAQCPNNTV